MNADDLLDADPELALGLERAMRRAEIAREQHDRAPSEATATELRAALYAVDALGAVIEARLDEKKEVTSV
jgi:hypothetical protein